VGITHRVLDGWQFGSFGGLHFDRDPSANNRTHQSVECHFYLCRDDWGNQVPGKPRPLSPKVTQLETSRTQFFAHALQGITWTVDHEWEMDDTAPMYFGFVCPASDVVALTREYLSDGNNMVVDLYQATFTGGTILAQTNRNLRKRLDTPPVAFRHSVTPGALTDRITGFSITTGGSVSVGKQGDISPFVHVALTSYVLKIGTVQNTSKSYKFTLDYRLIQPDEDK
jgi:hypothetical protein